MDIIGEGSSGPTPNYLGGGKKKGGGGGIFGGVVGGIMEVADFLRAGTGAVINEQIDLSQGRGFSPRDVVRNTRKNIGWSEYLGQGTKNTRVSGASGKNTLNNRGLRTGLGFVLDVGLDPLTYLSGTTSAIGKTGARATAETIGRKVLVKKAAGEIAEDVADSLIARAGRRGAAGLTGKELAELGFEGGVRARAPGSGRIGRAITRTARSKPIPAVELISHDTVRKLTGPLAELTRKTGATPTVSALRRALGGNETKVALKTAFRSGDPQKAETAIRALTEVTRNTRKGKAFAGKFQEQLPDLLKPFRGHKDDLRNALEGDAGAVSRLRAAKLDHEPVRQWFNDVRQAANDELGEKWLNDLDNYFAHLSTPEAKKVLERTGRRGPKSLPKVAPEVRRGLRGGEEFLGETLKTGSVDEIMRIASKPENFGDKAVQLFEKDPFKVLTAYGDIIGRQVGKRLTEKALIAAGDIAPRALKGKTLAKATLAQSRLEAAEEALQATRAASLASPAGVADQPLARIASEAQNGPIPARNAVSGVSTLDEGVQAAGGASTKLDSLKAELRTVLASEDGQAATTAAMERISKLREQIREEAHRLTPGVIDRKTAERAAAALPPPEPGTVRLFRSDLPLATVEAGDRSGQWFADEIRIAAAEGRGKGVFSHIDVPEELAASSRVGPLYGGNEFTLPPEVAARARPLTAGAAEPFQRTGETIIPRQTKQIWETNKPGILAEHESYGQFRVGDKVYDLVRQGEGGTGTKWTIQNLDNEGGRLGSLEFNVTDRGIEVHNVEVTSTARRQGVGQGLTDAIEDVAQRHGMDVYRTMVVNPDQARYILRSGYQEIESFLPEGGMAEFAEGGRAFVKRFSEAGRQTNVDLLATIDNHLRIRQLLQEGKIPPGPTRDAAAARLDSDLAVLAEAGVTDTSAAGLKQARLQAARGLESATPPQEIFDQARVAVAAASDDPVDQVRALSEAADRAEAAAEANLAKAQKKWDKAARALDNPKNHATVLELAQDGLRAWGTDKQAPEWLAEALVGVSKFHDPANTSKLLKAYDYAHNLMKAYLIATPGFHNRNIFGGVFNNFLYGDMDVGAYRRFIRAWNSKTPDEIVTAIREAGVVGKGQAGFEVRQALDATRGTRINPLSQGNAWLAGNRSAGEKVETLLRGALAYDVMRKGGTVDDAIEAVHRFHFDYDDLSQVERGFVKRVVPFYTFTRNNLPLQLENVMLQPAKYARYMQVKNSIEQGENPDGVVPQFIGERGGIRLPFEVGGSPAYIAPNLPFQDLAEFLPVGGEGSGLSRTLQRVGSNLAPQVKVPVERMMGKQFYEGIPFKEGYVPLPTPYRFLAPVLEKLPGGLVRRASDGTYVIKDADLYTMDQAMPILSRARRLAPSEERYQQRVISTWVNFAFGPGLIQNTRQLQESEQRRRDFAESSRTRYGPDSALNRK